MGSLITLLAVADILGNNTAAMATYSKRLVLTALMGEPWGFMGSKRLLWEMYNKADTTTGLTLDIIEQVFFSFLFFSLNRFGSQPAVTHIAIPLDVDTCNIVPVLCYLH